MIENLFKTRQKAGSLKDIWKSLNQVERINKLFEIFEFIKQNQSQEDYEKFVKYILGDSIAFDEEGKVIFPDDLNKILTSIKEDSIANEVEKKLPYILKYWETIKEYIQRKKANNILNDGLEVRNMSINEILESIVVLNRPVVTSLAVEAFERIKGSEMVLIDLTYTASLSTAIPRTYTLAEKIVKNPTTKKYPYFSVQSQDKSIILKVLHPQDQSSILSGHDTNSCFRANGKADDFGKSEYTFFQYSLITPYGGVLKCENADTHEVYMGTPLLVNGNCMMFHSYETAIGKKADVVNELLIKAAREAILNSNGSIDIVFITDLNKGTNGIHTEGKISMPSFFEFYSDGEYAKYKDMYTNLDYKNIVLAIRVRDKILSGADLIKWYEEECNSDPRMLIKKLNLHFGERNKEFDFGRQEIKEQLDIPELPLLNYFLEKIKILEEIREVLALWLQLRKLEGKKDLSVQELEELNIIKMKIEGKSSDFEDFSKLTISQLVKRLQQNREEELELYSGKDINLIAEAYGIDLEKIFRERAEEKLRNRKTRNKKSIYGKAISKLLARSGKSRDKSTNEIIKKINSGEEISDEELKQVGIDVEEYRRLFEKSQNAVPLEVSQEEIEGRIKKSIINWMKDTAQKEEIVAEILFKRVTDQEIRIMKKKILIESIVGELKHKTIEIRKRNGLEEFTEEEMNQLIHTFDVDSLIEGILDENISEKQAEVLNELENGEYKFNIEKHKEKIADRIKLERRTRMTKLAKLKAGITMGIETKKKIERLKRRIDGEKRSNENISRFIYGNSWYIALDTEGYVLESRINYKLDESRAEEGMYIRTLSEFKKREITPATIRTVTKSVPAKEKAIIPSLNEEMEEVLNVG